jgi:hypothetical protein
MTPRPSDSTLHAITIAGSRAVSGVDWDETHKGCSYATFFHSRAWSGLWEAYTDGEVRPDAIELEFSDGARAVLPMSLRRGRQTPLGQYLLSPAGTYGGWISTASLGAPHRDLLAAYITGRGRDYAWRVNPYEEVDLSSVAAKVTPDQTHAVSLEDGFDRVLKRWTKGHRSAATKARREGVVVSEAEGPEAWLEFGEVYADSVRRWGERATSVYDDRLFLLLSQMETPRVRLWLARKDEVLIAGALCLYAMRHVSYWLGAARASHFHLRPVHLLMYEAIEDACRRGYDWFDLNPSGGHEGVAAFKRGFGVTALPAPLVVGQTSASRLLSSARRLLSPLRSLHS